MIRTEHYFMGDGAVHVHTDHTVHNTSLPCLDLRHIPTEDCTCDAYVRVKQNKKLYVSTRHHKNQRRSVSGMLDHLLVQISNQWKLDGRTPVMTVDKKQLNEAYITVKSMSSPNFIDIPPYFTHTGVTRSETLKMPRYLSQFYQKYDVRFFSEILGYDVPVSWFDEVWHELREGEARIPFLTDKIGIPWESNTMKDGTIPTLKVLAARAASVHNNAFGGTSAGPNVAYTLTNSLQKLPKVYAKLCKPTHTVYGHGRYLANLTPLALTYMIDGLEVAGYAKSYKWYYEKELEKVKHSTPMFSSAGIRAGVDRKFVDGDVICHETFKGKKVHQLDRSLALIENVYAAMIMGVSTEKLVQMLDRAWALIEKNEVLCGMAKAEIIKALEKCRLFNIPTLSIYLIAKMVHGYRQVIERGTIIGIGINFWSGGAWTLAQRFHALEKGYTYYYGDFSALDTTIKAALLRLYSAFSKYYIDPNSEYETYQQFLRIATENLTFKCVHFFDNIWRMVYGGMPSGAYETSHGDSWIVCFLYMQYFASIGLRFPAVKSQIDADLRDLILLIIVYGDDSILCVPDYLTEYVNIYGFHDFVKEYYQMTMRDLGFTKKFCSIPDNLTGGLIEENVVFLSKYFVRREYVTDRHDLPAILPYRHFRKLYKKFAFGSGEKRDPRDHVLAAIGMVYDSFGTNKRAYDFCRYMFLSNLQMCTNFGDVVKYAKSKDSRSLTQLLRKVNISLDKLAEGFPSQEQLLDMHRYNPDHHFQRERPQEDFIW